MLAAAGYKDTNGDGLRREQGRPTIELSLIVPGRLDGLDDVDPGHRRQREGRRHQDHPPSSRTTARSTTRARTGKFDLLLNNGPQLSNTPWTYYKYIFQLPIQEKQTRVNFARYSNQQAWKLVQQLDQARPTTPRRIKATSQAAEDLLQELPVIPLWYNGMWSMANTRSGRTGRPRPAGTPKTPPTTWNNCWNWRIAC